MIVSADDFFKNRPFVIALLSVAHETCFRAFLNAIPTHKQVAIMSGIPGSGKSWMARNKDAPGLLIVDNTNLHAWEISPYALAASAFGAKVVIYRIACDSRRAFERQTHGVPALSHARMQEDFIKRDVLPWWTVVDVNN